ncbi:MAG: methyltransferase domain-containing protein [Rickettsiales bacterium]|jgi:tRNA1(Val) A37 N6-methylase TrmN6|nr:methyltransferase domain-containing protein [Rickettsiales bacterium]
MKSKQEIFTMQGGRVKFRRGIYNPSCDAVWLAAFAGHAQTILDAGVGTGAATLCCLQHNPSACATGLDISPAMLEECAINADLNGRKIELICADILNWKTARTFDIVMTNPPYFKGTPLRQGFVGQAHHNADLTEWTRACIKRVKPRGYFYAITDAARAAEIIAALAAAKTGDIEIIPLFGAKNTAERALISARKGARGGCRIHRGFPIDFPPVLTQGLTIASLIYK